MSHHTIESLNAAVRRVPLADRLIRCQQIIGTLCAEGRCPKMRIPVTPEDEDIVLGQTLEDASTLVSLLLEYFQCDTSPKGIDRTFELTTQLRSLIGLPEQKKAELVYDSRKEIS